MADYASEIENAVGIEIYGPIFKAGLFLFVSGVFSAAVVSAIVSKADTWEALDEEFDVGKNSQLVKMATTSSPSTPAPNSAISGDSLTAASNTSSDSISKPSSDDISDLDI